MARKQTNNEEKKNYKEFEAEGNTFKYSGRMFPEKSIETAKCTIVPMTLCLNGMITIKGCKLFRTDKNSWIQGPQYAISSGSKNTEYKDYLYISKDLNKELDSLVLILEEILDK